MGIIAKQSIRSAVLSYLGIGLGYVNVVLLFPKFFSPAQFGLTRVLLAVAAVAVQVALLGMVNTVIRFAPHFKKNGEPRGGLLGIALVVALCGIAVVGAALFLFQDLIVAQYSARSGLFATYYWLLLPLMLLDTLFNVLQAYARAMYSTVVNTLVREVLYRLLTMVLILAFHFDCIGFEQFMVLFVGQYLLLLLVQLIHLHQLGRLQLSPQLGLLSLAQRVEMRSYAFFTLMVGASGILLINIDSLMVGAMMGLDQAAFYVVAFYMTALINVPSNAIMGIAVPLLADAWKHNQMDRIKAIYAGSSINQLVAGGLIFAGIWANEVNLFALLPNAYANGRWVLLLVGMAKMVDVGFGVNGGLIHTSPRYRVDMWFNLALISVAVLANWWLIPLMGLAGAALATLLSLLVFNLARFVFIHRAFGLNPFTWRSAVALALTAVVAAIVHWLPNMGSWPLDITLRSIIILALYLPPVLYFRLSEDISAQVDKWRAHLGKARP